MPTNTKYKIQASTLTNIANAIRAKLGTQDTMTAAEMAGMIAQIENLDDIPSAEGTVFSISIGGDSQ